MAFTLPEGYEEVAKIPDGYEELKPDEHHIEVVNGLPTYVKGAAKAKASTDNPGDYIKGAGEAALQAATGIPAFAAGMWGGAMGLGEGTTAEERQKDIMQKYTYQPRTEMGEKMGDAVGEAINSVGLPMAGHAHMMPAQMRNPLAKKTGKVDLGKLDEEVVTKPTAFKIPDGYEEVGPPRPPLQVTPEGQAFDPRAVPDVARQAAAEQQRQAQAGLDASTKDITYENVPPDGVIPRSRPDGSLEVPKGNEWVPDENGIPVRQNMPVEPTELPLQNVNVDQPHVADMGNAIQEANGPKLGVQDTYGSEPLKFPASQRGAIDLGTSPDRISGVASMGPDHPAVREAAKALATQRKQGEVERIVNRSAYVDNITTPEQVVAEAPHAKDMTGYQAGRAKTMGAGSNAAVLNTNNPLVKFLRWGARQGERAANYFSETHITGPEGLAPKWNKLHASDRNDVMAVLMKQDRAQKWYSPAELREAGLSERMIDVVQHIKEMEALKLKTWNEELAKQGKPPVIERPGHFPGNFEGDYRSLAMDKDGKVIGFVGANTKRQHDAIVKKMQKEGTTFVEMKRRGLASMGEGAYNTAMSELAKVLAEHDPEFAALQKKVHSMVADNANAMYAADVHALGKKGIWGSEGNKPWKNATENTNEAMAAYKKYWDTGMRSHLNMEFETQMKGLLQNPELSHLENTKSYVEKYMQNMTGRSASDFGRAMDGLIDTLPKALGLGPSVTRGAIDQTTKRVGQVLMGFGNLGHTAVQMLQVPAMSVPQFVNMATEFKLPMTKVAEGQAKGVMDTGALLREAITGTKAERDPYSRAIIDFANENGMRHFSEFQDIKGTDQGKVGRVADTAIDLNRQIPEMTTRPFTFFTIARMLEDVPGLSMEQKLSAALNATDEAMINYAPREKPMIYGDLGQIGKLTGSLSTFKHGAMSQAGRLVSKNKLPALATLAASAFALAGVRGIYGYDDADSIVKYITGLAGNRRSIREIALDPYVNAEWIKSGALSAWTGLDLAGRVNVNGFIPSNPLEAAVGPFGAKIAKVGERLWEAGKEATGNGNGPIAYKNLALEVSAGGPAHHNLREALMNDPETNRLAGQDALPGNERTPEDIRANKLGFTSLRQGRLGEEQYNDMMREKAKKDDQKALEKQAELLYAQGLFTDKDNTVLLPRGQELVKKFVEREGDPDDLIKRILGEGVNMHLNKQQRLQGIPDDSIKNLQRYENYKRSREYAAKP